MLRRAARRASGAVDEPNVILPLATSWNERGVQGFTHGITNREDQSKLNCFYELVKNPVTGKGTLSLVKRPGVTINAQTYGSASDTPMLISRRITGSRLQPATLTNTPWVFFLGTGGTVKVADLSTTTTIFTDAGGYSPLHVSMTAISTVPTVVLQSKTVSLDLAHRVFFSSGIGTWTEITDVDFTGKVHRGRMEHLDGFALIMDRDNKIWNSTNNELDTGTGTSWLSSSFISKQIKQDYPIGLARLGNQILAFGDYTVEMFYNAGNTVGSPLGRITHQHEETGLVAPYTGAQGTGTDYYAIVGKTLFFVGRRAGGASSIGVFAYSGGEIEKISTPYIEKILAEKIDSSGGSYSYYSTNAVGFNGRIGIAISLTPPTSASQRWLMFFPEVKEWFEWTSTVFQPVNDGEYFLGLGSSGNKVYNFPTTDNWQDNGTSFQWFTQFRLPTNGSSTKFLPMYGVDADTDTAGLGNTLTAEISIDDCVTFSTLGTIDLTAERKVNFEGGSFSKAHIRLGNTNSRPTRLHNFLARVE